MAGSPYGVQGLGLSSLGLPALGSAGNGSPPAALQLQPEISRVLNNHALDLMGEILAKIVAFQSTQMQQSWFGGIGQGIGQQAILNRTQFIEALIKMIQLYDQLQKLLGQSATSLQVGDQDQTQSINCLIAHGPLGGTS